MPIDTIFSRRGGVDVEFPASWLAELVRLAREEDSGLVRLVLASTLQRLPVRQRGVLATALAGRSEDRADQNLPALIWTGLIPVAEADAGTLIEVANASRMPLLTRCIARRLGEDAESSPGPLNRLLETACGLPHEFRAEVVAGLGEALAGWRLAPRPASWERFRQGLAAIAKPPLPDRLRDLDVVFGSGRAIAEVRRLALDEAAPLEARRSALATMIASRPDDLRPVCERLLRVRFLNAVAVRGLILLDDPAVGRLIAASYRSFHPSERRLVIAALATRPAFAMALLDQVEAGKIPRQDISAFDARQIRGLGDARLAEKLSRVWGELRESSGDQRARIEAWRGRLDPSALARADRGRGRAVFERTCGGCHRLHGQGGDAGPDLTGAGRQDLGYLLENLIDPNASVSADFRLVVVAMNDGRTFSGLVRSRTERTLTIRTQAETVVLDRREVEAAEPTSRSLMPEGLLDTLSLGEARDLLSYLMHPTQVPLPGAGR
jgi:putative heme-binding domain-containing protein